MQIEDNLFINCTNLSNIKVEENNKVFCSKLGVLFTYDMAKIIFYPPLKQTSTYFIPQGVKEIDTHAFFNNNYLKYIIMPTTLNYIGENAFVNCKFLNQVVIPENVTQIHPRAFTLCPRITIRCYKNSVAEEKRQEKEKKMQTESAPISDAPMPTDSDIPFEPEQEENSPLIYGRSLKIKEELSKVIDLSVDSGKVLLDGEILNTDSRELKSGKFLVTFDLYDGSSTITCKAFVEADKHDAVIKRLKSASGVKVNGTAQFDPFAKELGVIANVIIESTGIKREVRKDEAKVKRVELHMHTQMSQMDGMTAAKDLLKRAVKWGMKSIAITDHGVVQAFPEAHKYLEKDHPDLKVIYGVEAYLAPDKTPCVSFSKTFFI